MCSFRRKIFFKSTLKVGQTGSAWKYFGVKNAQNIFSFLKFCNSLHIMKRKQVICCYCRDHKQWQNCVATIGSWAPLQCRFFCCISVQMSIWSEVRETLLQVCKYALIYCAQYLNFYTLPPSPIPPPTQTVYEVEHMRCEFITKPAGSSGGCKWKFCVPFLVPNFISSSLNVFTIQLVYSKLNAVFR